MIILRDFFPASGNWIFVGWCENQLKLLFSITCNNLIAGCVCLKSRIFSLWSHFSSYFDTRTSMVPIVNCLLRTCVGQLNDIGLIGFKYQGFTEVALFQFYNIASRNKLMIAFFCLTINMNFLDLRTSLNELSTYWTLFS